MRYRRFGVSLVLCLAVGIGAAIVSADEWVDRWWPAMFMPGGPGQQMLVRSIDLSLQQVPSRVAPVPRRKYEGFLLGPHFSIVDAPFSQILLLNEAVQHPDNPLAQEVVHYLRESGSNAVRLYCGYWWDPLGASTTIPILAHFGHVPADKQEEMIENWSYADARRFFDYLAGNGFDVAMVVTTVYYDPDTKKVYPTREVADNVDGVLEKAAERNAGTLARWWQEYGHGRRLVLEIGNEGIGYMKDSKPNLEQYSRIVATFAQAIKQANSQVDVGMVVTHGFRGVIGQCREVAPLIDHVITHLYDQHRRDWGLTYPGDATRHLDELSAELDASGYEHAQILITEYNFDLWSRNRDTVGHAVANTSRQIVIAAHPRVSGMFIHNTPGTSLFCYSDGSKWTLCLPGVVSHQEKKNEHLPDTRGEQLGPRFRMLPTGYCQQLLEQACQGELLDTYAMADFGQIAYLITRQDEWVRILLSNVQPQSLRAQIPYLREAQVAVFTGKSWHSSPSDDLAQPYGVTERSAPDLRRVVAPPFSVVLIEGHHRTGHE